MSGANRRAWPLPTVGSIRRAFWSYVAEFHPAYDTRRNRSVGQNDLPADLRALWCEWLDAAARDNQVSPMMAGKVTL